MVSKLKTEDGKIVTTGDLIWYVNYLKQVKPTRFNIKGKSTVKYFYSLKKAVDYAQKQNKL